VTTKTKKGHSVTIRWGKLGEPSERSKQTYSFKTKGELDAFMLGVNEMDGWMGYEEIDPNEKEEETNADKDC
jgi:hypothetical protein